MSYYYNFPYEFTDHAIARCRERLKLETADDILVRQKIIELIKKSNYQFETRDTLYIRAKNSGNLFFVIKKVDLTIITCTPVSVEKQMKLSLNDDY